MTKEEFETKWVEFCKRHMYISKDSLARYALTTFPKEWHGTIALELLTGEY